jgi:hypothetical protein
MKIFLTLIGLAGTFVFSSLAFSNVQKEDMSIMSLQKDVHEIQQLEAMNCGAG